MTIQRPFHLKEWIAANRALLRPPVSNKQLYVSSGDYIVMVVGGPNARKDYHYNETEELFYQLEGRIVVTVQEAGKAREVEIDAGEMFLLPAKIPHRPVRPANSVGLVIERKREGTNHKDGLMWFCDKCNSPLHAVYFPLRNIEKDFLPHFRAFYADKTLRTCKQCGHVMEADKRFC